MKSIDHDKVKLEIVRRIALLTPDAKGRWGRMSAHQAICHLNDSLLCAMGEREASIDHSFKARALAKWCGLYLPMRWPKGITTRPEIDQELGGTAPGNFDEDRRRLLTLTEKFARKPREFQFAPHPIFLEMTEKQWMRWGYLHADHHLRQFGV